MGPVVLGDGSRLTQVVGIDHDAAPAAEPLGNGVLLPAERVGDLIGHALRGALFEPQRDPVVPRVADRIAEPGDPDILRIRFQELRGTRVRGGEQSLAGLDDSEKRIRHECVQRGSL